jgi:hypothetical protein
MDRGTDHSAPQRGVEAKTCMISRGMDHRLPILQLARCGGGSLKTPEL